MGARDPGNRAPAAACLLPLYGRDMLGSSASPFKRILQPDSPTDLLAPATPAHGVPFPPRSHDVDTSFSFVCCPMSKLCYLSQAAEGWCAQ